MSILKRIVEKKKQELTSLSIPPERYVDKPMKSLTYAIRHASYPLGIIAEVKKASPSKGIIASDFHPVTIAKAYENIAASGISVLTDESFFQGHPDYLTSIKKAVNIPVLRKDFLIDEKQVTFSERIGADAILLIAAILDSQQLAELHHQATELGMEVLVEVHNEEEVEKVFKHTTPSLIGVNNRNLATFETDISTTERLRQLIPNHIQLISESGIHNKNDVDILRRIGVDGLLIGEAFMTNENKQIFVDSLFKTEGSK